MTQLGIGVAAMNHDSAFSAAYEKGAKKSEYWTHTLDDTLNLIARLPALAARIYRNAYHPGKTMSPIDKNLDLVGRANHDPTHCGIHSDFLSQATIQTCLAMGRTRT